MIRENEMYRKTIQELDIKGRVMIISVPSQTRTSFIENVKKHYKHQNYTIHQLKSVSEFANIRLKRDKNVVIFDNAFGFIKLEQEQHDSFLTNRLYTTLRQVKVIFLVYPQIYKNLRNLDSQKVSSIECI